MITIIRGRDSGKAKELLEAAQEYNAAIITQNKRSFLVKAHNYGFHDVEVLDYDDLMNDNYDVNKPVLIHNADKMLYHMIQNHYGLDMIGFTATEENE